MTKKEGQDSSRRHKHGHNVKKKGGVGGLFFSLNGTFAKMYTRM